MKKALIIAITIASLVLIFAIGKSMTGMMIYDNNTKELCQTNNDCSNKADVCCLFADESAGVCDTQSRCEAISGVTQKKELQIERPARIYSPSPGMIIFAGTIFILAIALALAIAFYKIKHKIHVHKSNKAASKNAKGKSSSIKNKDSKSSKNNPFYNKVFPIKVEIESAKVGLYIALIVVIVALVAILLMIY